MPDQTIIWTVLPNGSSDSGITLTDPVHRLSVFVSPRLRLAVSEGNQLEAFPDFLNWPKTVKSIAKFTLHFDTGDTVEATLAQPSPLDSGLWQALFSKKTFVRPYVFDDFTNKLIISYATLPVLNAIKSYYQEIGFQAIGRLPLKAELRNQRENLSGENARWIRDLSFDWTARDAAAFRGQLVEELSNYKFPTDGSLPFIPGDDDVILSAIDVAENRERNFKKARLFHSPPVNPSDPSFDFADKPEPPPLPKTEEDFKEYIDFHEALSSLGDYPDLLRRLGIVIDLEFPQSALPDNAQLISVEPDWTPALSGTSNSSPLTAIEVTTAGFVAAPNPNAAMRIEAGVLDLNPEEYGLVQVDVDGVAIKAINFATSLNRERDIEATDTPEDTGLPTLRSGGLSVVRNDRDLLTYAHFARTKAMDDNLTNGAAINKFFAEDLLRGYRVDVWSAHDEQWRSLCRRIGTYNFTDKNIKLKNIEDEGILQLGMTTPTPEAEGEDPPTDDLYLGETLFRWAGWSLVAPLPGKALHSSSDPTAPPVDDPTSQPITPFKLVTDFKVVPKSLPRLRFGGGYRLRVRAVDLAGNSPSWEDAPNDLSLPVLGEKESIYLRYEPVGTPYIVLRRKIDADDAGESLARLVIRSYNNQPQEDDDPSSDVVDRHIAPPRTSQLMAETHGVFDDESGKLMNDASTYHYIADHDKPVDVTTTDEPLDPAQQMSIPYLPDILAVGAAIRDLPATPDKSVGALNKDDLLVYKEVPGRDVRSGSVTQISYGPTHENTPGLLALYTFEEGKGKFVHDVSGYDDPLDLVIDRVGRVTWGESSLTVDRETIIKSIDPARKIVRAVKKSKAFTLEVWIEPASLNQPIPARIVTMSLHAKRRNFSLDQGLVGEPPSSDVYDVRFRTENTDKNGLPSLTSSAGAAKVNLTHVVYTRDADGEARLYINGTMVASQSGDSGLSDWTNVYPLVLANENDETLPWLGTYHLVAIYDRALSADEVDAHCAFGPRPYQVPIPLFERMKGMQPFRLRLTEGNTPPDWNSNRRILTICLPKAEVWHGPLSSYCEVEALKLMGVWQWLREYVEERLRDETDFDTVESIARDLSRMVQYAKEGGLPMLTPSRQISLVHAVQQPLGHPQFKTLTARRGRGDTFTRLEGELWIHGKSTAKVDLMAEWQEPIDDPAMSNGPEIREGRMLAAEVPLKALDGKQLLRVEPKQVKDGDGLKMESSPVGKYDPENDSILFADNMIDPENTFLPPVDATPSHEFGDTKHRLVRYKAVSTSRFREYFQPEVPGGFSRASEEILVNVPSSEQPAMPGVKYIIPAYGWTRKTMTNLISSRRQGKTLRVYLDRGWFSSGEGELLGVVLSDDISLNNKLLEERKNYITQWGQNPIWGSRLGGFAGQPHDSPVPTLFSFKNKVASGEALDLPGFPEAVNVAGHQVAYDDERQLWYCDIEIDSGHDYYPFIRLALARYQPDSIEGVHLSPVILADYSQLAPDRAVVVTFDPYCDNILHISLSGDTYTGTAGNSPDSGRVEVSVERQRDDVANDLGWEPVDDIAPQETLGVDGEILWHGTVELPETRELGRYRLVIKEYEEFRGHADDPDAPLVARSRLVYAETIVV